MVLGPAVRGTTGPRTTCPGGQFLGGTSCPATPFHWSVPTNRTLSSTGPLSVQLKRSYRLHASIKAYFVGKKL